MYKAYHTGVTINALILVSSAAILFSDISDWKEGAVASLIFAVIAFMAHWVGWRLGRPSRTELEFLESVFVTQRGKDTVILHYVTAGQLGVKEFDNVVQLRQFIVGSGIRSAIIMDSHGNYIYPNYFLKQTGGK